MVETAQTEINYKGFELYHLENAAAYYEEHADAATIPGWINGMLSEVPELRGQFPVFDRFFPSDQEVIQLQKGNTFNEP